MAALRPAYLPLSNYAVIGNTHTSALVASDGSIDWCCLPHFDSGAVFCRLLDADKGGFFRVGPTVPFHMSRRYRNGTALLDTDFSMEGGSVRITDFMHSQRIAHSRLRQDDPQCHRLLRRVEGLAGECEVEFVLRPTFDFAREPAALALTSDDVRATGA